MTPSTSQPAVSDWMPPFLRRAEAWMDARGRAAWIAAMILGFVFIWPLGLALLAYLIWSKRMFCRHNRHSYSERRMSRGMAGPRTRSSGNSAFDAYKAETLDRLAREQDEFEGFLRRLRESKDKAEFDQYLAERDRARAAEAAAQNDAEAGNQAPGTLPA